MKFSANFYDGQEKVAHKTRQEKVAKRRDENQPIKFYHVSTHKFKVGEQVTAGEDAHYIDLTNSPIPHYTIAAERILVTPEYRQEEIEEGKWKQEWDGAWYCYEVVPNGKLQYDAEFKAIQCVSAEVVRNVGNARSILENHLKNLQRRGVDINDVTWGSKVLNPRNIARGGYDIVGRTENYWGHSIVEYKRKGKNG